MRKGVTKMNAQTKAKFRKMIREDADFAQKVFKDKDLYQAIYGDDPANTTADVSNNWQSDPKYLKDTKGLFAPMLKSVNKEARPFMLASMIAFGLVPLCFLILFFVFPSSPNASPIPAEITAFFIAFFIILSAVLGKLASNKEAIPMYRAFKENCLKQYANK